MLIGTEINFVHLGWTTFFVTWLFATTVSGAQKQHRSSEARMVSKPLGPYALACFRRLLGHSLSRLSFQAREGRHNLVGRFL